MKKLFIYFFLVVVAFFPFICRSTAILERDQEKILSQDIYSPWYDVVSYARDHLPQEGQLRIKSDGFVYLKVDDDYIYRLFPMLGLSREGFRIPPYFRSKEAPGAHISVFYADERKIPEEIAERFHFQVKGITIVQPSKEAEYVILVVDAPELEQLREKYGLGPKLHGHEFHITLAKKRKIPFNTWMKRQFPR